MGQTINLVSGLSTFGNLVNANITISTLNTTDIKYFKSLNEGSWFSWTTNAPEAFQGFSSIEKGKGYVVETTATKTLTFTGNNINVNDITYEPGLAMIAAPFNNRLIGNGYMPRIKMDTIKTYLSESWLSWVGGAPDGFQGFLNFNSDMGYVVNIDSVYDSYLNNDLQNKLEGVRFNLSNSSVANGTVVNGIRYTNPNGLGLLNFDSLTFDPMVPPAIMFFSVAGVIGKIDFAIEYLGKSFLVSHAGITYSGVFIDNDDYTAPTIITNTISTNTLEISYTPETVISTTFKEMTVILNGVSSIIEFAPEYLSKTFTIWKDGKIGTGVFTEGTVTLTI